MTSDLIGARFAWLTVISYEIDPHRKRGMLTCRCDCGRMTVVRKSSITSGGTISCGCRRGKNAKHGMKGTPEYMAYDAARQRCRRRSHGQYRNYGGRGIEFRFDNFDQFFAEIGMRPGPSFSLDRIDVNGHYEPGNIRWAALEMQMNNRRDNVRLALDGREMTMAQWSRSLGIPYQTIKARHAKGWPVSEVLRCPKGTK